MAITTNRNIDLHGHTTPDVQKALNDEADKRNVSKSRLIHELLVEGLRKLGHRDVTGYEYRLR